MRKAHPASPGGPFAKTAGTHAKVRYRCFLPDLAGFTSPRRPDHKPFDGESGIRTHDTLSSIHAFQACAFSRSAISPKTFIAESVGFEPTVPLPVRLISSQVPSTTRPALHGMDFQVFCSRRARKKSSSNLPHSSESNPRVTSTRWLCRSSSSRLYREPAAPIFGSAAA